MIALTIIVVILTYSQLWDPVNACVKWGCTEDEIAYLEERIQYDGRYLTCSFFPKPGRDCPCWEEEKEGTECWDMTDAEDGRCFRGVCYNKDTYGSVIKGQRQKRGLRLSILLQEEASRYRRSS
ncbi:uncharacterized protein LOC135373835 isoform X2 [Ornithodoros turicata]|uniref:uncharacterized protein LOC135373835 isoform X2 n=1 Tax=Ornithodoros turicata TaxID=34597 RepID=UPI0031394577